MPGKPIYYFLSGVGLFAFAFEGIANNDFELSQQTAQWAAIACLLFSQFFSWIAVVKGIRLVKNREAAFGSFALNVISIIGSSLIILLFIYLSILLLQWHIQDARI